ncbi:MAG: hypothetical protein K2G82_07870 [Paramuribaculum sp.]|nr:hypothetical protein [Paramuribaculum sp.]
MSTKNIQLVLFLSVLLNVVLGSLFFLKSCSNSPSANENMVIKEDLASLQNKAAIYMRNAVCENLYYPQTYDPVRIRVDSAFYGPLTDVKCVQAAIELIDLRSQYSSAQEAYNYAVDKIKFFGTTDLGDSHWGKDRDEAKAKMKDLQEKIDQQQLIIKNRDTSMDGMFVGWRVIHRYRAANSQGEVSFGNVLYVLNQNLTGSYFRYSMDDTDKNNIKSIKKVIEAELGIQN